MSITKSNYPSPVLPDPECGVTLSRPIWDKFSKAALADWSCDCSVVKPPP